MNRDYRDPKKHVTPVDAGDDWGDLDRDRASDIPHIELQPRRPDRGIPTKRDLNPVSAKRHAPHAKLCDDDPVPAIEPISVGGKEGPAKPAKKAAKKTARKTAKSEPKDATKRSARKRAADRPAKGGDEDEAPAGSTEAPAPETEHESAAELNPKERGIPISHGHEQGSKRFRVNEIAPQRPVENRAQKAPLTISRSTGKWGSTESPAKNAKIQGAEEVSSGPTNVRTTLVWITCAGIAVIMIVAGAILVSRPPKADAGTTKRSAVADSNPDESENSSGSKAGKPLDTLINREAEARKIFAKYASSKSVDDFAGMLYAPERNRALVSRFWEPLGAGPGWQTAENCTWAVTESGGIEYAVLSGALPDYSGFNAVFRREGDAMKLDWRATTGHSSASFSELKQGQGDAGEVRAILSPGDFHTFTLPESEFRCYRLTAPDREENVWAYTKLNGSNDVQLSSRFVPSQLTGEAIKEIPVVLSLARGPAQSLPNQWMIVKVVRLDWLDE